MLVCRLWRDVGAEFLYQDVVLRRLPQPALLLRTLKTPGNNYGRYISRFSLVCITQNDTFDDLCAVVSGILSVSPRIEQFNLANAFPLRHQDHDSLFVHDWSKLLTSLAQSPSSTCLTHMRLAVAGGCGTLGLDPCLLNNFPKLASLDVDVPCVGDAPNLARPIEDSLSRTLLPKLRHLRYSTFTDTIGDVHLLSTMISNASLMPRLNMLTLSLPFFTPKFRPHASHLPGILRQYGPRLTYLHLRNVGHSSYPHKYAGYFDVQQLLNLCPKLEHLIVPRPVIKAPLSHPTLRWLDVWTLPEDMEEESPSLEEHCGNCPNLESVRRLDNELSRWVDLPLHLPPDSTFPPLSDTMFFEMSNTAGVYQFPDEIVRKEAGYIFKYVEDDSDATYSDGNESSDESSVDSDWDSNCSDLGA